MTETTVDNSPSRGLTPISATQLRAYIELAVDKDAVEGNSVLVDMGAVESDRQALVFLPVVEMYIHEERIHITPCTIEVWPRSMYISAQDLFDWLEKNTEDETLADKPVLIDDRELIGIKVVDDTYIVLELAP